MRETNPLGVLILTGAVIFYLFLHYRISLDPLSGSSTDRFHRRPVLCGMFCPASGLTAAATAPAILIVVSMVTQFSCHWISSHQRMGIGQLPHAQVWRYRTELLSAPSITILGGSAKKGF